MDTLYRGAVDTSPGTYCYGVRRGYYVEVRDIVIVNTGATAANVIVTITPNGQAVAASNYLFPNAEVPAKSLVHIELNQHMDTGDFIQAIASVAGVTLHISGDVSHR